MMQKTGWFGKTRLKNLSQLFLQLEPECSNDLLTLRDFLLKHSINEWQRNIHTPIYARSYIHLPFFLKDTLHEYAIALVKISAKELFYRR